jgi:hypothetical protein
MKLMLATQDATAIEADLQFVKHFDGLVGGSEAAINRKLRGALAPVFDEVEKSEPPSGRIVRPNRGRVGSRRLLVLGLGPLDDFGVEDLRRAIDYATRSALEHGFAIVATPIIGISEHVGLPVDRAYRILLSAFFRALTACSLEGEESPIEELRVFDRSEDLIGLMARMTEVILTEMGLDYVKQNSHNYLINVGMKHEGVAGSRAPEIVVEEEPPIPVTGRQTAPPQITKVLFLLANPRNTEMLRLQEEVREVDAAVRQADYRSSFDIRQHGAVRVMDLQGYMLRHRPEIVHFSGHGHASPSAIVLEDISGRHMIVDPAALTRLFSVFRENLRCVILNACYSAAQGEAIATTIDCVIGMSSAIEDRSAIGFSKAFYQALAYGRSVQDAFDLGCVEIGIEGLPDEEVPQLLVRPGANASSVRFVPSD